MAAGRFRRKTFSPLLNATTVDDCSLLSSPALFAAMLVLEEKHADGPRGHRRQVAQRRRRRAAACLAQREPVAPEVHALDGEVGGDRDPVARHHGAVVARAHAHVGAHGGVAPSSTCRPWRASR